MIIFLLSITASAYSESLSNTEKSVNIHALGSWIKYNTTQVVTILLRDATCNTERVGAVRRDESLKKSSVSQSRASTASASDMIEK